MRHWEDVSKEEEKIMVSKIEGRSFLVEEMQKAPELLVSELLMKEKELKKEKKQSEVAGWFTEKIEEKASKQEFKDTEEMVQWRSINQ